MARKNNNQDIKTKLNIMKHKRSLGVSGHEMDKA